MPTRKAITLNGIKFRRCIACGKRLYSNNEIEILKRKSSKIIKIDYDNLIKINR